MDWFRSHHGAPMDPKFIAIANKAGSKPGVVAALWWALMDRASQSEPRGSVAGFDCDAASAFFGWPEDELLSVISALRSKGMIDANDHLPAWHKRNPIREREDDSLERVRRLRERQKETPSNATEDDVTPSNATKRQVTPRGEERRGEVQKNPSGSKSARWRFCPEDFQPAESHLALAKQLGVDLPNELAKFREHEFDKPKSDPGRAFSRWLRNARDWGPRARAGPDGDWASGLTWADEKKRAS